MGCTLGRTSLNLKKRQPGSTSRWGENVERTPKHQKICHNQSRIRKSQTSSQSKKPVEETPNRTLNLSRINQQSLCSFLDYVSAQEIKTRSSFLTEGSFPKETLGAGRSVWHDRHVGIVEVPGSNPGPSTKGVRARQVSQILICLFS